MNQGLFDNILLQRRELYIRYRGKLLFYGWVDAHPQPVNAIWHPSVLACQSKDSIWEPSVEFGKFNIKYKE